MRGDEAAKGGGYVLTGAYAPGADELDLVPRLIDLDMAQDLDRAEDDDELLESLDGALDRRGWWAERLLDDSENDRFGSRLWLLTRAKETAETRALARDYAEEALRWLVEDRIAERVDVELLDTEKAGAGLFVRIVRGDGRSSELRYPAIWRTIENGTY
jgi:phage gp46-like protein